MDMDMDLSYSKDLLLLILVSYYCIITLILLSLIRTEKIKKKLLKYHVTRRIQHFRNKST